MEWDKYTYVGEYQNKVVLETSLNRVVCGCIQCDLPEYSLPSLCNFDFTLLSPMFLFSLFICWLLSVLDIDFREDFDGDVLSVDILAGDLVGVLLLVT